MSVTAKPATNYSELSCMVDSYAFTLCAGRPDERFFETRFMAVSGGHNICIAFQHFSIARRTKVSARGDIFDCLRITDYLKDL